MAYGWTPLEYCIVKKKESSSFGNDRRGVLNRLDFFLMEPGLAATVNDVGYKNRIGLDFDHKEVRMDIGRNKKGIGGKKEYIANSTLKQNYAEIMGLLGYYDTVNNHLVTRDMEIVTCIGNLETRTREIELLDILTKNHVNIDNLGRRQALMDEVEELKIWLIRKGDLLDREFTCNFKTLYEVVTMGIKGRLLAK
jgi:hypothetical protein